MPRVADNAHGRWTQLDGIRTSFIGRCEQYAGYTLPKLCTPEGFDQLTTELQHDYQAVGAQAVNHLANKIIIAGFGASKPFFVLDVPLATKQEITQTLRITPAQLAERFALIEKEALAVMERRAIRPPLYEAVKHLIVTGNCLMHLDEELNVFGIKDYCVRRSRRGNVIEIIIRRPTLIDELDSKAQQYLAAKHPNAFRDDQEVMHYEWITRDGNGDYRLEQWVDRVKLDDPAFTGKYSEEALPYRVLTWDLSSGAHYGTGLVEDYRGDFAGLSILSRAQVVSAVLASEFRWLVNPAGMTRAEDFQASANGAALPGVEGDIVLLQNGKSADLAVTMEMSASYVNRIGRGFLLGSAVTRNAERVTAEEIRLQAIELETSLGGVYSRLAVDMQGPLARWLLDEAGVKSLGQVAPRVVTGLDALSRYGELDELRQWLADLATVATLPEALQQMLAFKELASALAAPRRIDTSAFFRSEQEIAATQQAQQQQVMEAQANEQMMKAGAAQAAKQGTQQ